MRSPPRSSIQLHVQTLASGLRSSSALQASLAVAFVEDIICYM